MNLVNISMSKSMVIDAFDAMAVRFGALISDTTVSVGDLHFAIRAESMVADKSMSIKKKLDFVSGYVERKGNESGMTLLNLEDLKNTYKFLTSIKYKNAMQIKRLKECENWVIMSYDAIRNDFLKARTRTGFTQLMTFTKGVLRFNAVDTETPEYITPGYEKQMMKMSGVLLDRFNTKTTNDAFLVTGDFSNYITSNNLSVSEIGGEINYDAKLIRASKTLTFPHIIILTTDELEMVRERLTSNHSEFRINYNAWIIDLIAMPFVSENFDLIVNRYQSDIDPPSKLLQAEIDKNERLNLIKAGAYKHYDFNTNVYITSIGTYWDYLFNIKVITDETMDILKAYPDYDTLKNNCCIIIECLSSGNEQVGEAEYRNDAELKPDDEPVLRKRKVLDL